MIEKSLGLIHLLHRAGQASDRLVSTALGDSKLTVRQLIVLTAIADCKSANQTSLVHYTGIDRSTMTDLVVRLHGKRLLARRRNKQDARAYLISLTEAGEKAVREFRIIAADVEAKLAQMLPQGSHRDFVMALKALANANLPSQGAEK